jgi:hypothetical protein
MVQRARDTAKGGGMDLMRLASSSRKAKHSAEDHAEPVLPEAQAGHSSTNLPQAGAQLSVATTVAPEQQQRLIASLETYRVFFNCRKPAEDITCSDGKGNVVPAKMVEGSLSIPVRQDTQAKVAALKQQFEEAGMLDQNRQKQFKQLASHIKYWP